MEAEREFAIQDVWTVLRQKKEPRFQVHAMMSPADREGRALVHFAAWREAYGPPGRRFRRQSGSATMLLISSLRFAAAR